MLGQPVRRDDVRVVGRAHGRQLVLLIRHLPDLGHRIALRLREQVLRPATRPARSARGTARRRAGPKKPPTRSARMMNGLSPFLASGARNALKSGTSSPTHLPFLSGLAPGAVGIPPDELLLLAPRLAREVGGGAVVDDAAVGRPREAPAVAEVVLLVGGLARVRLVDELAVRPFDDHARVDPAARPPSCRRRSCGANELSGWPFL